MVALLNFVVGVIMLASGIYFQSEINVTMGCMNLIMAKLCLMEK